MSYGFTGDKMLYEARKRDYLRSKLSAGRRLEANVRADRIVNAHSDMLKKAEDQNDRDAFRKEYDSAMETTIQSLREQGSIKKIII